MQTSFDTNNIEQNHAFDMIAKTNNSFFLTGRAGTGKTTFLKMAQEKIDKKFIVLAPTGIAAINAGGQTIHSFFGLDFGVLGPGDIGTMNANKISLVRHIDTIIIDEVSMVRCDIMDAIDRTLRFYRKNSAPFGGLQMVFVGDMFQLEPVVTQEDREILMDLYHSSSFYFYKSAVIQRYGLPKIEFMKIYRQSDPVFIELLEHVRTGTVSYRDMLRINSRVVVPGEGSQKLKVTLTCTKKAAQLINEERLAELDGDLMVYEAEHAGDSRRCQDAAEDKLYLRVGAQVMFTRNDSFQRWANGTLATIDSLTDDCIKVRFDDGSTQEVQRVKWESIEYRFDEATKSSIKKTIGSVTQYPLRLAWAITIHKSQSLTFDRVAIDFGKSAFTNGQAYVALSRSRSLEGLELLRPMTLSSVLVSKDVLDFSSDINNTEKIMREINIGAAINGFIKNMDCDGAATMLYEMAVEEVNQGNYDYASELLARAMSYVVDDECIKGKEWKTIGSDNVEYRLMDAIGLFYAGREDESERIIAEMLPILDSNFDGLYILSRCYEEKEKWDKVDETYKKMMALFNQSREMGLDSISYRKFKYRLAILNERVYSDPGAGLMRQLLAENPAYDKYHTALRSMLIGNAEARQEFEEETDNPIASLLFDREKDDASFLELVRDERDKKSIPWNAYRRFINNLKLAMPC